MVILAAAESSFIEEYGTMLILLSNYLELFRVVIIWVEFS